MIRYFFFSIKNLSQVASAFAPEDTKLDHELIPELEGKSEMPFNFKLVKLSLIKGKLIKSSDLSSLKEIWLDYQPNSLAWPLFSIKLKNIIENCLIGNENIDWVSCKVNSDKDTRLYYIPRFNNKLDVLDTTKTIYVKGTDHIIKPCFSLSKISKYCIFHKPSSDNLWKITSGLYVNEYVKKETEKAKIANLSFEKTSVS